MAAIRLHVASTAEFKYDRFGKQFHARLSELGCKGIDLNCARFFNKLERGVGFILKSDSTGKQMVMRLVKTNKIPSDWDATDFDVTSWIFKPVDFAQDFELKISVDAE